MMTLVYWRSWGEHVRLVTMTRLQTQRIWSQSRWITAPGKDACQEPVADVEEQVYLQKLFLSRIDLYKCTYARHPRPFN